jgi:hypothetical protein
MGPARRPLQKNSWIRERDIMKRIKKVVLDEDLAKVGVALRRAAKQARKIALQTNTPLVIWETGRVIKKRLVREKDR